MSLNSVGGAYYEPAYSKGRQPQPLGSGPGLTVFDDGLLGGSTGLDAA